MRTGRRWILRSATVLAAVVLATGCGADQPGDADPASNAYLDITLPALEGNADLRLRDFAGGPVVVNFFASWCVPCVTEMPDIERVKQDLGSDVAFVGINVNDTVEDARSLVERTGVSWQVARDVDGELVQTVGVVAMPTTLLIDAGGNVVEHHTGVLSEGQLRDLIESRFGIDAGGP